MVSCFGEGFALPQLTARLLINNASIQTGRPCGGSSPLTRHWKSHSSPEPRPNSWISSSSSSPMSSPASRCTAWWTGRVTSSTPLKTLRYSQPACTPGYQTWCYDLHPWHTRFNLFAVSRLRSALQRDRPELLSEDDSAEHDGPDSLWVSETGTTFLLHSLV